MRKGCLRWFGLILFILVLAVFLAVLIIGGRQSGLFSWMNVVTTPTYQNRGVIVLDSVQPLSMLTTNRYNFSTIVTSEREMPGILQALYGERQVLVAVGHVTAGIDLSQLGEQDIAINGDLLTIVLPPPVLQDCFLNEGESYVIERDTGVFARSAPELEGQARQFAVQRFRDAALEDGILDNVAAQAQMVIGEFITGLQIPGVNSVSVVVTPPDPAAPLPPSCR